MAAPLRWLAVILPVVLIAVVEALVDRVLDPILQPPFDVLVAPAAVLVVAVAFAAFAFRHMDRLSETMHARAVLIERTNASLVALRRVGVKITALVEIDTILQAVVDEARQLLDADIAFITLAQPDGSQRLAATAGE